MFCSIVMADYFLFTFNLYASTTLLLYNVVLYTPVSVSVKKTLMFTLGFHHIINLFHRYVWFVSLGMLYFAHKHKPSYHHHH